MYIPVNPYYYSNWHGIVESNWMRILCFMFKPNTKNAVNDIYDNLSTIYLHTFTKVGGFSNCPLETVKQVAFFVDKE